MNNNIIIEGEVKRSQPFMKMLEILFYPQIKLIMDLIFFIVFSIFCLVIGMIGFMFAALFFVYIFLLFFKKTRKLGITLLELCGIVISFYFFKFMVIFLFFPLIIWLYIKTYINICKNVITPENSIKENFKILILDYYQYLGFFASFANNMAKIDAGNKEYQDVPIVGK